VRPGDVQHSKAPGSLDAPVPETHVKEVTLSVVARYQTGLDQVGEQAG